MFDVVLVEGREALAANAGLVAVPSADGTTIEMAASLGFTTAEQDGLAAGPDRPAAPRSADALTRGEPIFLDEGEPERRYPDLNASSAPTASVPLRTVGPVLGALGFRFERGHRFTEAERAFAMTLADHCAHALERARLYDAERRSREALAVLASIGEHLARSLDPDAALRTLAELAVPAVADQCVVDLVRGDGIERRALVHADPALQDAARTLEHFAPDIASDTPVAVAIREGRTQLVPVTQELPDSAYRSAEHRAAVKAIELRSMLTAPLVVRGRTLGAFTFGWRRERAFDDEDVELAEQLARRVALAIDNGALYQETHGERERLSALVRAAATGRADRRGALRPRGARERARRGDPRRGTLDRGGCAAHGARRQALAGESVSDARARAAARGRLARRRLDQRRARARRRTARSSPPSRRSST